MCGPLRGKTANYEELHFYALWNFSGIQKGNDKYWQKLMFYFFQNGENDTTCTFVFKACKKCQYDQTF